MSVASLTYSLDLFNQITFDGFNYNMPAETMKIISELAAEVGAPTHVKTPMFQKSNSIKTNALRESLVDVTLSSHTKKKKGNKHMELSDEVWDTSINFKSTRIEQTVGIASEMNNIRSYLNKLTDKNYEEYKTKIIELIEQLKINGSPLEDMLQISCSLFEIASTNRFYSVIYANIYTEIIGRFEIMKTAFQNSLTKFLELFDKIEYVSSEVNYDQFCKNNLDNEKRKSLSAFFVNLMKNGVIQKETIIQITRNLLKMIYEYISLDNKKYEVDELAENVAILYDKTLYENEEGFVDNLTIKDIIEKIANSNVKEYKSLTKKTVFKFMDLVDM